VCGTSDLGIGWGYVKQVDIVGDDRWTRRQRHKVRLVSIIDTGLSLSPPARVGAVMFHCSGALPSDIAVPTTREGYLPCFASATAMVPAHFAITKGGRIQYTCVFPAGSV